MSNVSSNVVTGVLVVCAVIVTGLAAKQQLTPASSPQTAEVDDVEELFAAGHRVGTSSAASTILEFADYTCRYCREAALLLDSLVAARPGELSLLIRHYPLFPGGTPLAAAIAAECAADQGRFREYHLALYSSQDTLERVSFSDLARLNGVADSTAFTECLNGADARRRVESDRAAGSAAGVSSTPTFIVGNRMLKGLPPRDVLLDFVSGR